MTPHENSCELVCCFRYNLLQGKTGGAGIKRYESFTGPLSGEKIILRAEYAFFKNDSQVF